jgi:hypothetical protein
MQQLEFDGVGEKLGQRIGCARSGIDRGELRSIALNWRAMAASRAGCPLT